MTQMELAFSSVSNVRNKRGIGTNNPMDIKRKTKDYYKQLYAFSVFSSVFVERGGGSVEINRVFK